MRANSEPLTRAAVPVVTNVQIVCGDCGGDALFPLKTLLTSDGYCSRCGGRNFVLAAKICGALTRHLEKGDAEK